MLRNLSFAAVLAMSWSMAGHLDTVRAADKDAKGGKFVHAVIFYLKKGAPEDEAKALVTDAHGILSKIPTVRGIKAGPPSPNSTPGVGVTDYTVGLLVLFDDAAGLKTYLEHAEHLKYVDKHKKHIGKVLVYDFVDPGK
jgi:hypothetical protein